MYRIFIKSLSDWLLALVSLGLLSPLFVIISCAIRIDSRGPVFFIQERLGQNGKIFKIYKFRSMVINNSQDKENKLFKNDPRITRVGQFIRRTSIDELPQMINILLGEMSFIGPRPPVPHFPKKFEEYSIIERQRFIVKPGISGLAQIRCREIHDWDINIPIDIEYVQNFSFINDVRLFFLSLRVFFVNDNIYREE